jgi:hypothetical protein
VEFPITEKSLNSRLSLLRTYRKEIISGAVVAVFGIAILAVLVGYYFPASSTNSPSASNNNYCKVAPNLPPPNINPPVAGYTYIYAYNTTNGALLGGLTEATCSLGGAMPPGPFAPPEPLSECAPNCTLVKATNEAYLNVTSDPSLPHLMAN